HLAKCLYYSYHSCLHSYHSCLQNRLLLAVGLEPPVNDECCCLSSSLLFFYKGQDFIKQLHLSHTHTHTDTHTHTPDGVVRQLNVAPLLFPGVLCFVFVFVFVFVFQKQQHVPAR